MYVNILHTCTYSESAKYVLKRNNNKRYVITIKETFIEKLFSLQTG